MSDVKGSEEMRDEEAKRGFVAKLPSEIQNETLEILAKRASTRAFVQEPLTDGEREAIIQAAFHAPTAGNLMMYSIIEATDQELKERLAVLCDNQPFIAKSPLVLVFVADYQKWVDLYEYANCDALNLEGIKHHDPTQGELFLGISDALIAAQNAVVASESLGIGSCYIGDIIENGEEVSKLLNLPQYTLPIAMVVFGRAKSELPPRQRQEKYVVFENTYRQLTQDEMQEIDEDMTAMFNPHGYKPGIENQPQAIYARKHATDFMIEMGRSAKWWIDRWVGKKSS